MEQMPVDIHTEKSVRSLARNKLATNRTQASNSILHTEGLSIGYETKKGRFCLEEHLDITIHKGELVCLIGPNGCGKSTLMRTIAGLQKPLDGRVFINGKVLKNLSPHKYAHLLSLVLTDKIQVGAFTVKDVVSIGRYPYLNYFAKLSKKDYQIVAESLAMVNLESYTNRFFSELSDGEKQRVMIAKALAQQTPLIMLDEPTAHLDLPNRVEIMNILKKLAKETKKAILLSTHELDLALQTADQIWLMKREFPLRNGTPEDLVLNGAFEDVFTSNAYDFDKSIGAFKVKHTTKGNVSLKGKGIAYLWTKRALEREDYKVSEGASSELQITVNDAGLWILNSDNQPQTCESISELLFHLKKASHIKA